MKKLVKESTMDKNDILVIDIEATCWEPKDSKPADQENEIIEIGLTVLNARSLELGPPVSILVRPDYSEVSEFCTQLTTITQKMLDNNGISYNEACMRLREEFNSRSQLWASWGDFDREIFFADSVRKGVEYPFGRRHMNLKTMSGLLHGKVQWAGVGRSLRRLGLKFEGTPHRGVDDSYNIARIFVELIKKARQK